MISALRPHNCNSTATRSAKSSRLRHVQLHRTVSHAANQPCAISNRSSPRHIPRHSSLQLHASIPPLPPPHTPSEYATRQISMHLQGAYGMRLILVAGRQLLMHVPTRARRSRGSANAKAVGRAPIRLRPQILSAASCPGIGMPCITGVSFFFFFLQQQQMDTTMITTRRMRATTPAAMMTAMAHMGNASPSPV